MVCVINSQPNLNLNFNSTQKDEEMEVPTTAGKEVVDVAIAVEDEQGNSIAVVLDQNQLCYGCF